MQKSEDSSSGTTKEQTPQYWDLLSEPDRAGYNQLKHDFTAGNIKRVRNNRLETFEEILEAIRHYAERKDDDDWKRFLVCGVCWMDQAIAINTRQLRLLVSKCKSSINGSLQKMGYTTNMSHSESWKILFPHIPLLKDHFSELRQWTIRYKTGTQPPPDTEHHKKKKIEIANESTTLRFVMIDENPKNEAEMNEGDVHPQIDIVKAKTALPIKFRAKMQNAP